MKAYIRDRAAKMLSICASTLGLTLRECSAELYVYSDGLWVDAAFKTLATAIGKAKGMNRSEVRAEAESMLRSGWNPPATEAP